MHALLTLLWLASASPAHAQAKQQLCDLVEGADCPDFGFDRDGRPSDDDGCGPGCQAEEGRLSHEAEAHARKNILEPRELPRPDTVAEREEKTSRATRRREDREHRIILAFALSLGALTRNPYAAAAVLFYFSARYIVSRPGLDLSRASLYPKLISFARPESPGGLDAGGDSTPGDPNQFEPEKRPTRALRFGRYKSASKWADQMTRRGWTQQQIEEAVNTGKRFDAPNNVNPGNAAGRYVHPGTGRFIVIDEVTNEILQVSGGGFKPLLP